MSCRDRLDVPLVVAGAVADRQVVRVAVAALAQGLDVLQRRLLRQHRFTTHPARHHAMQLARHGFVHFVAGVGQFTHVYSYFFAQSCVHMLFVLKPKRIPKPHEPLRHEHAGGSCGWRNPPMWTSQTTPLHFVDWRVGLKI